MSRWLQGGGVLLLLTGGCGRTGLYVPWVPGEPRDAAFGDGADAVATTVLPAISAGWGVTCALSSAGAATCWGEGLDGQLGNNATASSAVPVPVSGLGRGVRAISAGWHHCCAVTSTGGVECWGENSVGQLGDGTQTNRHTPTPVQGLSSGVQAVAVGGEYTCALTEAGAVLCWGVNINGELGIGTAIPSSVPTPVTGLDHGVVAISMGFEYGCALTSAGAVRCWGYGVTGRLGNGLEHDERTPSDVVGLGSGVSRISAGFEHTCALTTDGAAFCWGNNDDGAVGDGTSSPAPVDVPHAVVGLPERLVEIAAGDSVTCGLTVSGGVVCWGSNDNGALGSGVAPALGGSLVPVQVVGLGSGVVALSIKDYDACALTRAGRTLCWGLNNNGQLGNGSLTDSNVPVATLAP